MIEDKQVNLKELIASRAERRSALLTLMDSLGEKNINCAGCTGICCTSVANSMQIDLVQGLDLYIYLLKEEVFNEQSLKENIEEYRLNPTATSSRGQYLRKRYTCPFFKKEKLGCQISPKWKPYGCLGFNALASGVSNGENCNRYEEVLEAREQNKFSEGKLNELLANQFGLINDKQPIPVKLLEIHAKLKNLKFEEI